MDFYYNHSQIKQMKLTNCRQNIIHIYVYVELTNKKIKIVLSIWSRNKTTCEKLP